MAINKAYYRENSCTGKLCVGGKGVWVCARTHANNKAWENKRV